MKSTLLFSLLLSLAVSDSIRDLFRDAMQKYAATDRILLKSESPGMLEKRFKSFAKFHAMVEEVNNDDSLPYRAADNFLSILTEEERKLRLGLNVTGLNTGVARLSEPQDNALHTEYIPDRRDFSAVLPDIKDQQDCGSCWAFAAAAALEGQIFFTTGRKKVSLAEQEYLECVHGHFEDGCIAGRPFRCYDYSSRTGRIAPSSAYPYIHRDRGVCYVTGDTPNELTDVMVAGTVNVIRGDSHLLKAAASRIVSVAVHANDYFNGYESGVYVDDTCQNFLNHAVNVVGYGTRGGRKYWKIRNSFGPDWGEEGYMYMDREKEKMCGISSIPTYPMLVCKDQSCVVPNPDEGDSFIKKGSYDEPCFETETLNKCRSNLTEVRASCPDPQRCTIAKVARKCHMSVKESGRIGRHIKIPCGDNYMNTSHDTSIPTCTEKVYLSDTLRSEAEALRVCRQNVPFRKCRIVRRDELYYATNGATSGDRWLYRTFPCE